MSVLRSLFSFVPFIIFFISALPGTAMASISITNIHWNYHGDIGNTINTGCYESIELRADVSGAENGYLVTFDVYEQDLLTPNDRVGTIVGEVYGNKIIARWTTSREGEASLFGDPEYVAQAIYIYDTNGNFIQSLDSLGLQSSNKVRVEEEHTPSLIASNISTNDILISGSTIKDHFKITTQGAISNEIPRDSWNGGTFNSQVNDILLIASVLNYGVSGLSYIGNLPKTGMEILVDTTAKAGEIALTKLAAAGGIPFSSDPLANLSWAKDFYLSVIGDLFGYTKIKMPSSLAGPCSIIPKVAYYPPGNQVDLSRIEEIKVRLYKNGTLLDTIGLGSYKGENFWSTGYDKSPTDSGVELTPLRPFTLASPGTYTIATTGASNNDEIEIEVGNASLSNSVPVVYEITGGDTLQIKGSFSSLDWELYHITDGNTVAKRGNTHFIGSASQLTPAVYTLIGSCWSDTQNRSVNFSYNFTVVSDSQILAGTHEITIPTQSVTLLYPTGSFTKTRGSRLPIQWDSVNLDASDAVKIEWIGPSGAATKVLNSSAPVSGDMTYAISSDEAFGTYHIKISSKNNPQIFTQSRTITIAAQEPNVRILNPSGISVMPGSETPIQWTWAENVYPGDSYYIDFALRKGVPNGTSSFVGFISSIVSIGDRQYSWEIDLNEYEADTDYFIRGSVYDQDDGTYYLQESFDGPSFTITEGPSHSITFPTSSTTLEAGKTYTIRWSMTKGNGEYASIKLTPEGSSSYKILDDGPNTGSFVWTIPANTIPSEYTFRLTTLAGLHSSVDGVTIINKNTVQGIAQNGGDIYPSGIASYDYGSSVTFSITPLPNYQIKDVLVDGISQGAIETYLIDSLTENHTVEAIFEPVMHTLTVNAVGDGQGTISCTPDSVDLGNNQWSVPYGTIVTLAATPGDLSQFLKWTVDGSDAFGLQEEISITGDTSVTVEFALDSDQDGMSDAYERDNGLDPNSAIDRIADPDGDSLPNWMEHYLGTDPNDRYSRGTGRDDYWIIQPPVVASFDLAAFIDSDGLMHVWGRNATGLTAMEGDSGYSPPLKHSYGMRWKAVALGHDVIVAIKDDGTLWSWGEGEHGQLGDGTTEDRFTPACIDTRTDWIAIVAGDIDTESCFAINASGELWAWGDNEFNRLGLGDEAPAVVLTPTKVGGEDWIRVFPNEEYVMGYTAGGGVMAWGHWFSDSPPGEFSELSAAGEGSSTPLNPISDVKLTEMHASGSTVVYMRTPGGLNARPSPDLTGHETGWASLALTFSELYGVKDDGSLWMINCWENGSILQIDDATDWLGVWSFRSSTGLSVTYAIKQDGSLHALGNNGSGLLGDGQAVSFVRPRKISDKTDWTHAAIGGVNVLAVDQTGRLWGSPKERGLLTEKGFPLQESGSSLNFKRIYDTWAGSLALVDMDSGLAGCTPVQWSGGIFEPYGPNTASEIDSGCQALGFEDWVDLSQSIYAVQLRNTAGSVWNIYPMNTTDIYSDGQLIAEDVKPKGHVSIGDLQCYIKSDGTLWFDGSLWVENRPDQEWATWELLNYGEPTQIGTGRWTQAAATLESATFLREDGTLWAVGGNKWWQLGCGDVESLDQLTQVGADSDWVSVFSAPKYTLAVKADGSLWGWGANGDNQLGVGTEFVMYPKKIDDGPWKPDGIFPSQGASANENSLLGIKTDGTLWMLGGVQCSSNWTVDVALNPDDADNDGIPDTVENCIGTNRDSDDSDGDGILDRQEDANANGVLDNGETDATDSDTDNDQMPDGWERLYNLDPLVADANDDADNDGMTNLAEYLEGTNPIVSNSASSQTVPLPTILELLFE